jgi:DNA-binding transcriptional LysR family regulator
MDLEELRAFLQVVESGSFLAAADRLQVSRTTLRRRVGSLESRAGVSLLESTQQGIVLTDAGQMLARRGRAMAEEADVLLASIRGIGQAPSGILRVSLPVGMPPQLLATVFAALRGAYPQLYLETRFSDDPIAESLAGVDLAIHFSDSPPRDKWISYVVFRVQERLIAGKAYLARRGTPTSFQDLARHELFSWQAPGADARLWPLRAGGTFVVEPTLVSSDIHLIRNCCLAELGIGFLPDAMLPDPGFAADALVPVLPDLVGRERAVRVTAPAALADLPKIKMVLDLIRGMVDEL